MTQAVAQVRNVVQRSGFANPLTLGVLVSAASYVKVYADGELLTSGADYELTGVGSANGVEIEIIGAEDPDNYIGYETFTALYDPPLDQQVDLSSGGRLGATYEAGLDQSNRRLQALADQVKRSLRVPPNFSGDMVLPEPIDGYTLVWSDDLQRFIMAAGATGEPVTTTSVIRSIKDVGAACDGVTLDDAAWDQVAALGGYWYHPGGRSMVSRPVVFNRPGTRIDASAAGYDDSLTGASITATAGFVGEVIVNFGDADGSNMRSAGLRNIEINGGSNSDADGLRVVNGYDAVMFENVTVLKIGNGRHCFDFTVSNDSKVGQTVVGVNLFGIHRNDSNDAPAFRLYRQQECTFINCKGWGAGSTAGASDSASDVWDIDSCSGILLLNPSAVATTEHGFAVRTTTKLSAGIQIINPTVESVGKPLRIVSEMARTFASGGISPIPSVGDIISQPADGSGATGVVWFATAAGIYMHVLSGTFAVGAVYNAADVNLGTLTSILRDAPRGVRFSNPRFLGSVAGVTGSSLIEHAKSFDVDWYNNDSTSPVTPELTVQGSEASGELRTTDRSKITNLTDYTKVSVRDQNGADAEILATDYYALNATGVILLPAPVKGKRVKVTHDLSELTAASIQLNPGAGVSIDGGSAGSTMYLSGRGASAVLRAVSATEWLIESFVGAISVNAFGYRMTDRGVIDINASITIGYQTFGYHYTNNNASAIRTLQLTAISASAPLATNGGYKFTRTNAAYVLRIDPNVADEIVGSSGVGKYLQIDTVGATVELRVLNGKWYVFGDAASYSFEP